MKSPQQHPQADQAHSAAPSTSQPRMAQQASPAATAIAHSPRTTAQRRAIRTAFGRHAAPAQLQAEGEQQLSDEVPVSAASTQRAAAREDVSTLTNMSNQLKSGTEATPSMNMADVRGQRQSEKPTQLVGGGKKQDLTPNSPNSPVTPNSPALQAMFGPAAAPHGSVPGAPQLQRQAAGHIVLQRQVASNLANAAALTAANWLTLLRTNRLNSYAYRTEPSITSGQGANHDTYLLVWYDAIEFNDGTTGDMHVHMHEGVMDPDALSGGGAWVDGGAAGHGVNIDGLNRLKVTCVAWINDAYDSECTVA